MLKYESVISKTYKSHLERFPAKVPEQPVGHGSIQKESQRDVYRTEDVEGFYVQLFYGYAWSTFDHGHMMSDQLLWESRDRYVTVERLMV